MPYPVQERMLAYCDDVSVTDEHGAPSNSLPAHCELQLPPDEVAAAATAIFEPELKRDLVRRIADLDTKRINNKRLIDRAQALDSVLAEAKI
ncbi:MAG: hypothetical protein HC850_15685 [Rhodomicrobium sp.]|nr:hypothetical protein [Rhodomicrobium sp.]